MGLHLTPFEERMEPDEYPDPLDNVEFPRETRNPRKLERDRVMLAMRRAVNACGPFKSEHGFTYDLSPRMRAHHLNSTRYERLNLIVCTNSAYWRKELLRTWRCKLASARECSIATLPAAAAHRAHAAQEAK